jgi:hypothetical protein
VFLLGRPAQPGAAVPSVPAALRAVRSSLASIHPLAFCAKLAIVRTVVDIFFALGHWVIHRYVPRAALPDLLYRTLFAETATECSWTSVSIFSVFQLSIC